ncbi:hypothetical protein NG798_05980 [Ancylothrix sp. C2]|uniref:hypothetical protein n=1 Tax=Ancylothrix sp. D3o TaxID=2953691 RepID=UPI0021BB2D1A|nr:hypothetical protein [Ancylothrix sp. D3o]MCT7949329.1 hypothetical protein [Ancylothrix sp. D3o]
MPKRNNILVIGAVLFGLAYYGASNNRQIYLPRQPQVQYLVPVGTAPPMPVAPMATSSGWMNFQSPQGRFSVLLPQLPIQKTPQNNNSRLSHSYTVSTHYESYSVTYQDLPERFIPDMNEKRSMINDMGNSMKGAPGYYSVGAKRNFALGGHPGIEINLESPDSDISRGKIWHLMVERRVYTLSVITPYPENAEAFLRSFRFY